MNEPIEARRSSRNRWRDRESIPSLSKVKPSNNFQYGNPTPLILLAALALTCWLHPASLVAASTIGYVQGKSATPQSAQTVNVTFKSAQAAGHLNVVVVGWNDTTATVSSVTDTRGNMYARAVGPTIVSGVLSQSIYYAKNIVSAAAGANKVTVTFSRAAVYPDIRILEYSGADPSNPVDVTAASTGSSTTSSSGSATTTNPTDLIFAANYIFTVTTGPGSGFTKRLLTPDGTIAEDKMATTAGSYSATAPLNSSGSWIMQMVAFRTPSGVAVPTISVSPTSVSFGNVTVGSSATHAITLSNPGSVSVTVSQATATGSSFKITGLSLPLTLSAGQSAAFSATFSPTTSGSATGSISVASNASNSPLAVSLSGTGVASGLTISPTSTTFGNVVLGSKPVLPMILNNSGTASVTISQATITGAGFTLTGPSLPLTLQPGAQNTGFSTTFAPAAVGSFTGNVVFVSNASNSPANESLSGTGIHAVTLSWTASTSGVAGYNVYRGSISGGPYAKLNSSLVTGTNTYPDMTVTGGHTYCYVITAVNSNNNESAYSNQATAVVPSP